MRDHLQNLQALRGVACLLVVFAHLQNCEKQFGIQTPIFREVQWFGFAGVDLFFVLSGFLITSTNRKNLGRPAQVPRFLFRRFWRIYPMFWFTMAVATTMAWIVYGGGFAEHAKDWGLWWMTLLPASRGNMYVGQAWTLVYEVMFYLAFAVVLLFPPRLAGAALIGWGCIVVAGLFGPEPGGIVEAHIRSLFVLEFLGGSLIAGLAGRGACRGGYLALVAGIVYAVAAMVIAHAVIRESWTDALASDRTRVPIYGPAAVLFVYGYVALEGRLWLPRSLLKIGDASYSLYLLHPTVLGVGMWLGYKIPHSPLPHVLWLAGMFAASLAVGWLAYRFIERPLLNLAKRKRKRTKVIQLPNAICEEDPPSVPLDRFSSVAAVAARPANVAQLPRA